MANKHGFNSECHTTEPIGCAIYVQSVGKGLFSLEFFHQLYAVNFGKALRKIPQRRVRTIVRPFDFNQVLGHIVSTEHEVHLSAVLGSQIMQGPGFAQAIHAEMIIYSEKVKTFMGFTPKLSDRFTGL